MLLWIVSLTLGLLLDIPAIPLRFKGGRAEVKQKGWVGRCDGTAQQPAPGEQDKGKREKGEQLPNPAPCA